MEADERKVSTLELFFGLVFVFGITQVTAYLADHHPPIGFTEGLLLLALLWWAWTGFTRLGGAADIDSGWVRLVMLSVSVAFDYLAAPLGRAGGWVVSPGHFSERHGPVIIIMAPGQCIVAIGVGAAAVLAADSSRLSGCRGRRAAVGDLLRSVRRTT